MKFPFASQDGGDMSFFNIRFRERERLQRCLINRALFSQTQKGLHHNKFVTTEEGGNATVAVLNYQLPRKTSPNCLCYT